MWLSIDLKIWINKELINIKYMGSKSRISKDIVSIIQKYIDDNEITSYIEPFCGGCNVVDKIKCENRIATDINPYLITRNKIIKTGKDKL